MTNADNHQWGCLGKLLYFSLPEIQINRTDLTRICKEHNIQFQREQQDSVYDYFRSATSACNDRIIKKDGYKSTVKIQCRNNRNKADNCCRELIKETSENGDKVFKKLADIKLNPASSRIKYSVEAFDTDVDVIAYCDSIAAYFETCKMCAGKNTVINLITNYLALMQPVKVDVHGFLYFIPERQIYKLSRLECFIEAIGRHNLKSGSITFNAIDVIDDHKQRKEFARAFSQATEKEIALYRGKIEGFIATGGTGPKVLERWHLKMDTLQEMIKYYEALFRTKFSDLQRQYDNLLLLAEELKLMDGYNQSA